MLKNHKNCLWPWSGSIFFQCGSKIRIRIKIGWILSTVLNIAQYFLPGSDKKKLKVQLMAVFPLLTEDDLNNLIPTKDEIIQRNLSFSFLIFLFTEHFFFNKFLNLNDSPSNVQLRNLAWFYKKLYFNTYLSMN